MINKSCKTSTGIVNIEPQMNQNAEEFDARNVNNEIDREMWERAKKIIAPRLLLEILEQYLEKDGLLSEYALRLFQDFDLRLSYNEQL